jgi:hypothetical protein
MMNKEITKTLKRGVKANKSAPKKAIPNAIIIMRFSPHRSTRNPEEIDITP